MLKIMFPIFQREVMWTSTKHRVSLGLPLVMDLPTAMINPAAASHLHPLPPSLASWCGWWPRVALTLLKTSQNLTKILPDVACVMMADDATYNARLDAFWLTTVLIFCMQIANLCRTRRRELVPPIAGEMSCKKPTTAPRSTFHLTERQR